MLQERYQGSAQTNDLVWCHIHVFHFVFIQDREVTGLAAFDHVIHEISFLIHFNICLCNFRCIFFFCTQESDLLHVCLTVSYFVVRCFNKAHVIDLGMHTKCRDQTNVRTFRCFNRTQTAVVRIVNVTYLETCTLPAQTTGSECGDTTLVRDLTQRVGLIQELTQLRSSEE